MTRLLAAPTLLAGLLAVGGCGDPAPSSPPVGVSSSGAPKDQPGEARGNKEAEEYAAAIAPYVAKARATYPDAKRRYLAGLPARHQFFAVTQLKDNAGTTEQVFVAVMGITGDRISGRIASDILGVKGFKSGDPHSFPETGLVDWLITRPDGTEEGNVVGKFLDEWQKTRPKR